MNHGTCKHFNGMQNKACGRGVAYEVNWPSGAKPCIQFIETSARGGTHLKAGEVAAEHKPWRGAAEAKPCPLREEPTGAEVQKDREETDTYMAKVMAAIKVAGEWRARPKPTQDRRGVVECPVCKGSLHLSQSAYNGHVHGKCETADCVSWME